MVRGDLTTFFWKKVARKKIKGWGRKFAMIAPSLKGIVH